MYMLDGRLTVDMEEWNFHLDKYESAFRLISPVFFARKGRMDIALWSLKVIGLDLGSGVIKPLFQQLGNIPSIKDFLH